jgi:hypothetical protein
VTGDDVRALALALPETSEKLTWEEHPTFRVRDKIFVMLGADETTANVKATREAQAALVGSEPATFGVPAYVGRHGWVRVELARVDPGEMRELVEEAWRMTAPKRLVRALDAG